MKAGSLAVLVGEQNFLRRNAPRSQVTWGIPKSGFSSRWIRPGGFQAKRTILNSCRHSECDVEAKGLLRGLNGERNSQP